MDGKIYCVKSDGVAAAAAVAAVADEERGSYDLMNSHDFLRVDDQADY